MVEGIKQLKIRYRWIYSEGFGEWFFANYNISISEELLQEEMNYIEMSEGPRHGHRWSGFEYELVKE